MTSEGGDDITNQISVLEFNQQRLSLAEFGWGKAGGNNKGRRCRNNVLLMEKVVDLAPSVSVLRRSGFRTPPRRLVYSARR